MIKKIVISAGGTGGHISPGIALAEALTELKEEIGYSELFIHSLTRNKDNPDLRDSPCPVLWHNTPQITKTILIMPFLFLWNILKTIIKFRSNRIDCVIAMGGYSSLPALCYALLFRKKIFLCEQNRMIGKVTRVFAKFADKIAFAFPAMNLRKDIKAELKVPGNPIRKKIQPDPKVIQNRNLVINKKEKLNVLVMGGSQGARQINNMVINSMNNTEITKNFNFRLLTGPSLYDEAKAKTKTSADIISYSEDMKTHYEWAHIVIARSGAGVISECALYGLPQILIPYPYAADNHQVENAMYFSEKCGAWVLNQKDENNADLMDILSKISNDRELLVKISGKTLECSKPNAAVDTIKFFFSGEK